MFISLPVHCNVGLSVSEPGGETLHLSTKPPTESPPIPKSWQHPGFCPDPRQMVAAVARARDLINRQTASSVCQEALDTDVFSVLSHVSRLSTQWNLVGYTLTLDQIRTELVSRGPVVAAMPVHQGLLTHISSCMNGCESVYTPDTASPELGMVSIAILGWKADSWMVALPWGKFSKTTSAHTWDGCVYIPHTMVMNACAMCKATDTGVGMEVILMPESWNPPTTRPLPQNCDLSRSSGKMKHLKNRTVRPRLTDENVSLVVTCVVTTTNIVLAILTLNMMKTRKH